MLLLVGRGAPARLQQLLALPAHGRAVRAGRCLVRWATLLDIPVSLQLLIMQVSRTQSELCLVIPQQELLWVCAVGPGMCLWLGLDIDQLCACMYKSNAWLAARSQISGVQIN